MISIFLCLFAFVSTFVAGRRSLGLGLVIFLTWGYSYGILRANVLQTFSHFIFDFALAGLYLSQPWTLKGAEKRRVSLVATLLIVLVGWPLLVVLLPFQELLVSLVGLRGNCLFLPLLLLGARLQLSDLTTLAFGVSGLNFIALGFGAAEYVLGVPRFYPLSAVTAIIYNSNDIAGYRFHRIPATFVNAHAYAGTMVMSLPVLFGAAAAWTRRWARLLAMVAIGAAMVGVLMASTRQHFLMGVIVCLSAVIIGKITAQQRLGLFALMALAGGLALTNERFQRFKSLGDTDAVIERVHGSVNRGFFEILIEHPLGNGLGGGGTSMPYFLTGRVRNPIAMENEISRILLEQGVIGLLIWLCFLGVYFTSRQNRAPSAWQAGRRVAWICTLLYCATSFIGLGLMTSIPQSALMLLLMGWVLVRPADALVAADHPTARRVSIPAMHVA